MDKADYSGTQPASRRYQRCRHGSPDVCCSDSVSETTYFTPSHLEVVQRGIEPLLAPFQTILYCVAIQIAIL